MTLPPLDVHGLLRQYNLEALKSLGQNFLVDNSALQRIVKVAEIPPQATVLEVGAGLGSLTRWLAISSQHVIAVETDGHLLPVLRQVLASFENVSLVEGDILKLDPASLVPNPGYWVVANIPYNITSALIRHLLEADCKPACMVLTVQREVAERICAVPPKMSLLALSVQVYGKPKPVLNIPASSFYPAPQVDSSVVRIDLYPEPLIPLEHLEFFFRLAKAGFSQKRKTLRNSLSAGLQRSTSDAAQLLEAAGIDPQRRAETLDLSEWGKLVEKAVNEH
jgi:16S rRNA (adenine1518-N6/adenine1519-N6)-dimethyltransferase